MTLFRSLILILLCLLPSSYTYAMDYEAFSRIPLMHEGRVKPADSVGRIYKKQLSGSEKNAAAFLARSLFDPLSATQYPVFLIKDRQVLTQLGLEARPDHLYSLATLASGLQKSAPQLEAFLKKQETDWTPSQRAFVKVHQDALFYGQLLGTFSFMLPLALDLPADMDITHTYYNEGVTYLDIQDQLPALKQQLADIVSRKGEDISAYSVDEKNLALMLFKLKEIKGPENKNELFRIWLDSSWVQPWGLTLPGTDHEDIKAWAALAKSYRMQDQKAFTEAAVALQSDDYETVISLETYYKAVNPWMLATLLYVLSLGLCFWGCLKPGNFVFKGAVISAALATVLQATGIIMRVIILGRPPVGSLYESLLFVGLIVMVAALFIVWKRKQIVPLLSGVIAALGILLVAPVVAPDGDNLETLVAVLNTNFWLATHVLCITAGYAICILAAMLAHVYLVRRNNNDKANGLWSLMYKMAMVALFFTAFGTMLGGIWADQSWGRFWGWDPKENGALLIVLWIVWLAHARMGRYLGRIWLAAGFAMLNVVVALAWFGVNLLSVGLHSYGFINDIAVGLTIFCVSETVLIGVLVFMAKGKRLEN